MARPQSLISYSTLSVCMRNPSESDYLKQSLNLLEARVDSARKAQGTMQSKCGNEKAVRTTLTTIEIARWARVSKSRYGFSARKSSCVDAGCLTMGLCVIETHLILKAHFPTISRKLMHCRPAGQSLLPLRGLTLSRRTAISRRFDAIHK